MIEYIRYTLLVIAVTLCQNALGENTALTPSPTETSTPPIQEVSAHVAPTAIAWNRFTILATATAAVIVIAGIVASASLLLPLITYKICYLLGACNYSLNSYVDKYVANPREKRAVEYLGPLLQTLAAAYEKYGEDDAKKKPETLNFFVR